MGFKILTWGFPRVISSGWHTFDLMSSILFFFSLIFVKFIPSWDEVLTFIRPLRLLRLFKLKKRYRNVFGTLFILIPPMTSVALVMLLLYYFFAIIAMEIFSGVKLRNCCNGTIYESYYADPDPSSFTNTTNVALRYYLNSFEVTFYTLTHIPFSNFH
jgi:two pore calcium channel protein 1